MWRLLAKFFSLLRTIIFLLRIWNWCKLFNIYKARILSIDFHFIEIKLEIINWKCYSNSNKLSSSGFPIRIFGIYTLLLYFRSKYFDILFCHGYMRKKLQFQNSFLVIYFRNINIDDEHLKDCYTILKESYIQLLICRNLSLRETLELYWYKFSIRSSLFTM